MRRRSSSADRPPPSGEPPRSAVDFALARLARRAHSEGELAAKMERAGLSPTQISESLEYLRARRYLDDAAFARVYARSAAERRCWGPGRIRGALRQRAVADEWIEAALSELFPAGEDEAVRRALARYRRTSRKGGGSEAKVRAFRHLLARGFSPEAARKAIEGKW